MTLASAVGATLSVKHFSLSPLRLRPHKPHLLSPPTSTAALLTERRSWTDGDGDGVVKSLRFRRSAASLAGGALLHDAGATAVVMAGAYGLVLTFDVLTQRNLMEQDWSSVFSLFCIKFKSDESFGEGLETSTGSSTSNSNPMNHLAKDWKPPWGHHLLAYMTRSFVIGLPKTFTITLQRVFNTRNLYK